MPRILVVDDSRTVRLQARQWLSEGGYDVVDAADAAHGLKVVARDHPDLVVTDVIMPGMNGVDMIAELRSLPGHQKTPVFVVTTEATNPLVEQAIAAGATAWFIKPVKRDRLLRAVGHTLKRARSA